MVPVNRCSEPHEPHEDYRHVHVSLSSRQSSQGQPTRKSMLHVVMLTRLVLCELQLEQWCHAPELRDHHKAVAEAEAA